jgi:hypothetical protein
MAQQSMGSSVPLKSSDKRDCRFSMVDGRLAEIENHQSAIGNFLTHHYVCEGLATRKSPPEKCGINPFFL